MFLEVHPAGHMFLVLLLWSLESKLCTFVRMAQIFLACKCYFTNVCTLAFDIPVQAVIFFTVNRASRSTIAIFALVIQILAFKACVIF